MVCRNGVCDCRGARLSIEAINWAFSQTVERSSSKFVLVAMAMRCNDANLVGGKWACWPSISALAEDTCMDRKTVFDSLARLQESGLISDAGIRKGGTGRVTVYVLNSTESGTIKQSQKRDDSEDEIVPKTGPLQSLIVPFSDTNSPENGTEIVPKTGHGTSKEQKGTGKPKNITPRRRSPSFDFIGQLIANGVSETAAKDWSEIRKAKKLPPTQTAFEGTLREAGKAKLSMHAAITECCERGWGGFKAEWIENSRARAGPPVQRPEKFDPIAHINRNRTRPTQNEATGRNIIDITPERVA